MCHSRPRGRCCFQTDNGEHFVTHINCQYFRLRLFASSSFTHFLPLVDKNIETGWRSLHYTFRWPPITNTTMSMLTHCWLRCFLISFIFSIDAASGDEYYFVLLALHETGMGYFRMAYNIGVWLQFTKPAMEQTMGRPQMKCYLVTIIFIFEFWGQ